MMKTLKKFIVVAALLFAIQQGAQAQNWGFSLPFGAGGFAINGKNWTAGYGGAVVGGGRRGWGFQLPNGAGFYNGGGSCNRAPGGYYGGGYAAGGWTGYGGYYNRAGWNYGPNYQPTPSQTRPVQYMAVSPNGAAVYRAQSGRVWVQQPF